MAKYKLYEFNPVLYPRKLWIVIGGTTKDVKSLFLYKDGTEIEMDEEKEDIGAWSCEVLSKPKNHYGVVMWFPSKITVPAIAHEATHAALFICGEIGMTFDSTDNEQVAYLLQWIVSCADMVRLHKVKPIKTE